MHDHLHRLFAHLAWADAHAIQALREAGDPPRARELMAHIVGAELVWLARIEGRRADVDVWPTLSLYQLGIHAGKVREGYDRLLAGLDEGGVTREVHYVNSAGLAFTSTVCDILLHVALHGSYHRGQVALLVREGGAMPARTDYIAFVRGAPAATRMDGAEQA